MKNICIDIRMLYSSGIGTYIQNLLPYFDNQYKLFLLGSKKDVADINLKNAELIEMSSSIYSIKEQCELPIKIPKCDLFWSPHYNVPLSPIRAKKRIVTIHDVFHLKFSNQLKLSQKLYAKILFKAATKLSDEIITVSHFSKNEIIKYLSVSEGKIHVINNGVSNIFHVVENEDLKDAVRIKYSLPQNFILFVGNVKPHKNITNLIISFSKLKINNSFTNLKLVIAGKRKGLITGDNDLEVLIHNLGLQDDILFLDKIETAEMPILYNLASLLVFPSFYEGFGLPPLEAMSCGCPTVVSDIDCLKEIYENATVYIPPLNPEKIKESIQSILQNNQLKEDLIKKGRTHAKKFTWETSANLHLHIFEKTLHKNDR